MDDISKELEALKIIEQAIKRNEPMIIEKSVDYNRFWAYICPNCGNPSINNEWVNFCPICGQAVKQKENKK